MEEKRNLKFKYDLNMAQDAMKNEGRKGKIASVIKKAINTSQSMTASVDDSLAFVQLGYTLLRNPSIAFNVSKYIDEAGKTRWRVGGALKEHILDAWSEKRFNRQLNILHNSGYAWDIIKASGIDVLNPKTLSEKAHEETFQEGYADKIGLGTLGIKKAERINLGKFLKIYDRAYISLGNNTRIMMALKQAEQLMKQGITIENNIEEYKGLGKAVNNLTGRGTTTKSMAQIIPYTSWFIWSPKMIASSINLLGITDITGKSHGFYSKLPPKARAYAISQMAGGIGIATSIMLGAAVGGAVVHYNPFDQRFGDVEYGKDNNLSFNVYGKFAGYMRLVMMLIAKPTASGIQKLSEYYGYRVVNKATEIENIYAEGGKTAGEITFKFIRGKFNPVAGVTYDILLNDQTGSFDRNPITLRTVGEYLLVPMSLRNVKKEIDRDGTLSLLNYSLPNFFGIPMKDKRDYENADLPIEKISPKVFADYNKFGEKGFLPPRISPKITVKGKDMEMTDDEKKDYVIIVNAERSKALEVFVNKEMDMGKGKVYSNLTTEKKIQRLQDIYSIGHESGEEIFRKKYPKFKELKKTGEEVRAELKENNESEIFKYKLRKLLKSQSDILPEQLNAD
jgi:hypothetical protein